jgi:chromosomal replication initiator protein
LRRERGFTLQQVANGTGMSVSHLSEVERGVRRLSNDLLVTIAHFLEVQPSELIASEREPD